MSSKYPDNAIHIALDVLEDDEFTGSISGVTLKETIAFSGVNDFMVKVDRAFDTIGKPQAAQIKRSFGQDAPTHQSYCANPKRYHPSEAIAEERGRVKTLDLIMISRRHAEWQGIIKAQGQVVGQFETALACLSLMMIAD